MPGRNCAVIGCGSCRRTKGIGIFKLPLASDEIQKKRRDEWLGGLKKTREVDQDFREQIKRDTVYTCEKHFAPEDIEICKYSVIFNYQRESPRTAPIPFNIIQLVFFFELCFLKISPLPQLFCFCFFCSSL